MSQPKIISSQVKADAMAGTVTDQSTTTNVSLVFYVQEDQNSPYQGFLSMPLAQYSLLLPADIEALQLKQYTDWKTNTAALQAQAAIDALTPPTEVQKADFVNALVTLGWFNDVVTFVNAIVNPQQRLFWETLDIIPRNGPLLNAFAAQIWPSDNQARLDQIFRTVKGL